MAGIEGLKSANTLTGQIITISSGLLVFTVTFVEKFSPEGQPLARPFSLKIAWILLLVTICLGFWTCGAITGTMNQIDSGNPETNPTRSNINIPAALMVFSFIFSVVFLLYTG